MKGKHIKLFEDILKQQEKTNVLLEQLVKCYVLGHQVEKKKLDSILLVVKQWWDTDLKHHKEENNLLKKSFGKDKNDLFEADKNSDIIRVC